MINNVTLRSFERFSVAVLLFLTLGFCAPQLAFAAEDGDDQETPVVQDGTTPIEGTEEGSSTEDSDANQLIGDRKGDDPVDLRDPDQTDKPAAPAAPTEGGEPQQDEPQPQPSETARPIADGEAAQPATVAEEPKKEEQTERQLYSVHYEIAPMAATTANKTTTPKAKTSSAAKTAANTTAKRDAGVQYHVHIQNIGWKQDWKKNGQQAGTTGRSLRLEALQLKLINGDYKGSIEYRVHVQNKGWMPWVKDGKLAGTTGKSLRLEAIQIRLKGDVAKTYEIAYRAHVQNIGWQNWVSAGAIAGTTGRSLRVEAFNIRLIKRPTVPVAQQTVADGLYTMQLKAATSVAVAPASASNASGANVATAGFARWRLEDKWQVTWKGNGYELFNANSGKVLEAANGAKNIVANVRQANRNNSKSQRWAILKNADGSYSLRGMNQGMGLAVDGSLKAGSNVMLWVPGGSNNQKISLAKTEPIYNGTYQLFTKMDQSRKCADVYYGSVSNKAAIKLSGTNDGPNQHFIVTKSGDAYTLQAVSSGKYVTVSGSNIVQMSKNKASTQLWKASIAGNGGLVFTNVSSGKVLSVKGNKNANGVNLVQAARKNTAGQRWYPVSRALVSNGLYEMRIAPVSSIVLDVNGGSLSSGANAMVHKSNGGNNQKFAITAVKDGYYRICMPLASTAVTVQGASTKNGANVRMETYKGTAAQLWKPVVTDGGLVFVNKKSGQALSFASNKSGANVRQATKSSASTQKWSVVKTTLNPNDLLSYRMAVQAASGAGHAVLSNAASGYSISKARWNQLINAINACWREGYDLGFIMMDCNTGMTVSLNADDTFYGASTIKALYVTYLFEEYLEKGRLSWGDISTDATYAITISDNQCYLSLRGSYGSESGFENWLNRVGVGYIGTWGSYSPRTLAKAWTHMLAYSASNGRYVGTWKSIFNHSYYSAIHERLGGYRTTYSKPGWMTGGTYGTILNDAAVVDDRHGRRYLLSMMSSVYSEGDRYLLGNVAAALDAIHMEMPRSR